MKKLFFFALLWVNSSANAAPFQTSAEPRPFVCTTGEKAYEADQRNYVKAFSAMDLIESGECRMITDETRFRVLEKVKTKDLYYWRIEIIGEPPSDKPIYISGAINSPQDPEAVLAELAAEKAKYPPGCTTPMGGQVNRMEIGKDGQLFLKKYMVTTKCVDGKMRSFSKPLN